MAQVSAIVHLGFTALVFRELEGKPWNQLPVCAAGQRG